MSDATRLVFAIVPLQVEHPIRDLLGHALRKHTLLQVRRGKAEVTDGAPKHFRQLVRNLVIGQCLGPGQCVGLSRRG